MGNLLVSLRVAARTLDVYGKQLDTIQNNVVNEGTPGYAKQTQSVYALSMNLDAGIPGGVGAGPLISSRSAYAERSVRDASSDQSMAQSKADNLAQLETYFDITGKSGLSANISGMFNAFSQLSVNPNDQVSRQAVIDAAQKMSDSFNQTAGGLNATAFQVTNGMNDTVSSINSIASQIAKINAAYQKDFEAQNDPGMDAQLNAALEQLSQYSSITTSKGVNGALNVYLGGQVPLVLGDQANPVSIDSSGVPVKVLDVHGADVTSKIDSGQLAGELATRNNLLPSYLDQLNTLASSLADKVNQQLTQGVDANAAPGTALFTYDATAGAAGSMRLNPLTPDQIAAASSSAPGGNDNAVALSGLAKDTSLNGYTFTSFYGALAGRVGKDISTATTDSQTQQSMLTQARNLRSEASGVDLNEEATLMMQVQKAYQATSKLMSVLNDLTDTLVNLIK